MITLRHIIKGFQHVYVIVDALDECRDQDQLLAIIIEIISWKLGPLHLLATSRKEKDIEGCVGPLASTQFDLHSLQINTDIQTHIQETLKNDSKLKKWPSKVHSQIEAALMEGAHGM
jgi:ankyrin repeat domain-containing protein 50